MTKPFWISWCETAEPFTTQEIEERIRNTAWIVENHPPDAEMNVQVQELDRLVSTAAQSTYLREAAEKWEWLHERWPYMDVLEIDKAIDEWHLKI